jgi:murein DD-endopeptidase MepM/ murein hydrolase activator NlpD
MEKFHMARKRTGHLTIVFRTLIVTVLLVQTGAGTTYADGPEEEWEQTGLTVPGISTLTTTPRELYAGQNERRYWLNPYNGVYRSTDKGVTWVEAGLRNQQITDMHYGGDTLYATTLYGNEGPPGLYKSESRGVTWEHLGPEVAGISVCSTGAKVFLGTWGQGLWVSKDAGGHWHKQEEDSGLLISHVEEVACNENHVIVRDKRDLFVSTDGGNSWEGRDLLAAAFIDHLLPQSEYLYAGTKYLGIILSEDYKDITRVLLLPKGEQVSAMAEAGIRMYALGEDRATGVLEVYESKNKGISWEPTGYVQSSNDSKFNDIATITAFPSYLFVADSQGGVYRRKSLLKREKEPLLGALWENQKQGELLDRITSFFDHAYPTLGYNQKIGKEKHAETTTNFLGQEGEEPQIYYSGHNGYDFGLPYGTKLLAPADGLVKGAYCAACGNTLTIDHHNGYRTVYMHLQKEDLYVSPGEKDRPVKKGEVIGKVGMTGNTTGPHLHFEVRIPGNAPGYWYLGHPTTLVDPFGWRNDHKHDPWAFVTWSDYLGHHTGNPSKDLWKEETGFKEIKKNFEGKPLLMELDNISLKIPSNIQGIPLAFKLKKGTRQINEGLEYVPESSLVIEAQDSLGRSVSDLLEFITINITLTEQMLSSVLPETVSLYHWNKAANKWETLSSMFDRETNTLEGKANEISQFAVFGEPKYTETPITTIELSGQKEGEWFIEQPQVTLTSNQPATTFYSYFGEYWEEYDEPFILPGEGIIKLRYRSTNERGLVEELQITNVRIDTQGRIKKTLFIRPGSATIAESWY